MTKKGYATGSRNVFKDIGVPNAEEHLVKAQLVFKIDTIMKDRGLKQIEAADLFGIRQPDVSKMLRGEFRQFSVERLLRFLVALDQDVEIVVKPHRDRNNAPALHLLKSPGQGGDSQKLRTLCCADRRGEARKLIANRYHLKGNEFRVV